MMNKLAAILLASAAAGCATETDGVLTLSGELTDPANVTHVVATNPTTGERIITDIRIDGEADGRFRVDVPAGGKGAWIVTFADASKKGAAMRLATLQTGGIDAFSSKDGGSIDFGKVAFNGRFAHGTVTWNRLESVLGASEPELRVRAELDNLALRYSNPDVDGNGTMDAVEGHEYLLDIEGTYRMQVGGRDATISDLISGVTNPAIRYMGTAIKAGVPRAMGMEMFSGTVQFEQPFYGTALGSDTPMIEAGARIGQPHIKFGELNGHPMLGVVANGARNAPNGTYRFGFANGQLTFTDVFTPVVETMAAATSYPVPFVRVRTVDAACKVDCDISSIDLEWMRATDAGWETVAEPRDARLDVVTRNVHLSAEMTDGQTSQRWSAMPLDGTGLLRSELAYISSSELCYLAVSFGTEMGMQMTGQFSNPACF